MIRIQISLLILFFSVHLSNAQIWLDQTRIDTATKAQNLDIPWDMEWWGNDTLLITELSGKIKRIDLLSGTSTTMYEVSDLAREGQAGLMGLQPHPNWPDEQSWYAVHTYYNGSSILMKVIRLDYNAQQDQLELHSTIVDGLPSANSNTGCRLLTTGDYLYLTMGDVKSNQASQDEGALSGKVLRYHLDGSIPQDNPISGSPVFTLGHRNPQGITETENGSILISEHGPSSNDEINVIEAGRNYGWPEIVGPCTPSTQAKCDELNVKEPAFAWSPTIAPCGIEYYDYSAIPDWNNALLIATLKEQRLTVITLNEDQQSMKGVYSYYVQQFGRIRDVLAAPDGRIFLCTSNRDALGEPTASDDRIIELTGTIHNGISEPELKPKMNVTQNEIRFSEPLSGRFEILDLAGRILYSAELNQTNSHPVSWSRYSGVVIATFRNERFVMNQKIMNL